MFTQIPIPDPQTRPVPKCIDPVFAKTSQNARFLLSENERFGIVFVKTGSINSGTGQLCDYPILFSKDRYLLRVLLYGFDACLTTKTYRIFCRDRNFTRAVRKNYSTNRSIPFLNSYQSKKKYFTIVFHTSLSGHVTHTRAQSGNTSFIYFLL